MQQPALLRKFSCNSLDRAQMVAAINIKILDLKSQTSVPGGSDSLPKGMLLETSRIVALYGDWRAIEGQVDALEWVLSDLFGEQPAGIGVNPVVRDVFQEALRRRMAS